MKTCIIETHYHAEFLNTLIQLYPNSDIYTTKKVYDDLPESAKSTCSFNFPGYSKMKDFITSIPTKNYDLLFVNTIQETMLDLRNWKEFVPKCKSVLTLHNLNAWYANYTVPLFRLNFVHAVDSWWSQIYLHKLLKRFSYLSVCYEPMKKTAEEYFSRPTTFIPFALAQSSVVPDHHDDFWFTVPGTVSSKRRNYKPVINAFERIFNDFHNVRLYLLGKNEENLEFDLIPGTEDRIVTYDHMVTRETYDKILCDSDYVIIPSVESISTISVTREQYGITKSTNIHDAIKWRKPVFVPSTLPIDPSQTSSTIVYTNGNGNDLYASINQILRTKKEREQLKKNAVKNTERYTLEKTRQRLEEELLEYAA